MGEVEEVGFGRGGGGVEDLKSHFTLCGCFVGTCYCYYYYLHHQKVKEVMFSPLSVCLFVCLFVCVQDISKSCGRIPEMKFCGQVRRVTMTN